MRRLWAFPERKSDPMDMQLGQLIDGGWRKGGGADAITSVDPATEEVLSEFPAVSAADTQEAIEAANAAPLSWRRTLGWSRAEILHKCADVMTARTGSRTPDHAGGRQAIGPIAPRMAASCSRRAPTMARMPTLKCWPSP